MQAGSGTLSFPPSCCKTLAAGSQQEPSFSATEGQWKNWSAFAKNPALVFLVLENVVRYDFEKGAVALSSSVA